MRPLGAAMTGFLLLLALTVPALAGVELESEPATVGEEATIVVTDDDGPVKGREVTATYYPGSAVKRLEKVGRTDDRGRVAWTPELAGLVELGAGEGNTKTIGVRFDGMPTGALVIFLLASFLLVGGIVFGVRRMNK